MVTRVRAEVGGRRFKSPQLQLFLPNKHLYSRLEEPGLKIKTFSPDCIVPVSKPGLKGLRTGTRSRFSTSVGCFGTSSDNVPLLVSSCNQQ